MPSSPAFARGSGSGVTAFHVLPPNGAYSMPQCV
jgi:hypothetical protein